MRFGLVVVGACAALFAAPVIATSLKLTNEIELLAVDGKVMSGALLKGAESLELDGGEHQLLFKVNKVLTSPTNRPVYYSSAPLLLSFNGHNIASASISLPNITSVADSQRFDVRHDFQLIGTNAERISIRRDVLPIEDLSGQALEDTLAEYNRSDKPAAMLSFTPSATEGDDDNLHDIEGMPPAKIVKKAGYLLEKMLNN